MELSLMDLADETRPKDIAKTILKIIREQAGGRVPIPVPVEKIAKLLDIIDIEYEDFKSIDGTLVVGEGEQEGLALIGVNANQSSKRIRYTIGHELGHWLIPSHKFNKKYFECVSQSMRLLDSTKESNSIEKIEIEANIFSCELLLPDIEFRQDIRALPEPRVSQIVDLSFKYDVSKLATGRRFVSLNDYECAIVQSHERFITHIYKHKDFPSLCLKRNNPLPPKSHSAQESRIDITYTELLPISWVHWLSKRPPENSELYEQVLFQRDGYRLTLLYLDTRDCMDDEELENEKLELRNISFFKR